MTRYFLRRLAEAQREQRRPAGAPPPSAAPGASRAYSRALSDAVALFVLMPGIALFSIGASVILTLHPAVPHATPDVSPLLAVLAFTCAVVLLGHVGLGLRLRRYRRDPGAARAFDTDRDREIAFWQRVIVTALCAFIAPLYALAVLSNG